MGLAVPWRVESSWTGIEPVSLALIGRFLSTVSPGKSWIIELISSQREHFSKTALDICQLAYSPDQMEIIISRFFLNPSIIEMKSPMIVTKSLNKNIEL